jgi:hypothetical protein
VVSKEAIHGYVFVGSDRPDPYVNSVCAMLKMYGDIQISFVGISDPRAKSVGDVATKVRELLEALAGNEYVDVGGTKEVRRPIPHCDLYVEAARVLSVSREYIVVPRSDLDGRLQSFITRGPAIFDVTALQKDYLVDLVSLLTSRGAGRIGYFSSKKSPNFAKAENNLIHALSVDEFDYVDLTCSDNVKIAMARIGRRSSVYRISLGVLAGMVVIGVSTALWGKDTPLFDAFQVTAAGIGLGTGALQILDWRSR